MKYSVIGVDAESGANRAITVTGDSEDAAHTAAKAAGVFPTSITLKPEDAPIRATTAPARELQRGDIICPNGNCGYFGRPDREARGSLLVGLLLSLACLLPGFLYLVFTSGYNYICPNCGIQIRSGPHN